MRANSITMKLFAVLPLILLTASCTSIDERNDYDLQWDKHSVQLSIVDETGALV